MKIRSALVIGISLLIIIQFGFVLAQETGEEITIGSEFTDICKLENSPIGCGDELTLHGKNLKISEKGEVSFTGDGGKLVFNQGQKNEIVLEGTQGIEISPLGKITFIENNKGKLSINGNKFEKISSGEILLDQKTGEILETNFLSEGGTSYNINDNKFTVHAKTQILYNKNKKELIFEGDNLIKIDSFNPPITLKGLFDLRVPEYAIEENFIDGNVFISKEGNYYANKETLINQVRIKEGSNIPLFFDGKEHEGDYISLSDNKVIFSAKKQPIKVIFENIGYQGNNYLKFDESPDIPPGLALTLSKNSKVIFENYDEEKLKPKVILSHGSKVYAFIGKLFSSENGEIFYKTRSSSMPDFYKFNTFNDFDLEVVTLENPEKKAMIFREGSFVGSTENRNHNKETEKSREIPK